MYGYIYKTTNMVNGKIYVGQHKSNKFDSYYKGSGKLLHEALNKYGVDNFSVEVLEECDTAEYMNEREIYWIAQLNSTNLDIGYNLSDGGHVPRLSGEHNGFYGKHHSKEVIEFLRQRNFNYTEETRDKIRQTLIKYNQNLSLERKAEISQKLSDSCKGEKNGMYGKRHTSESKKLMSEKRKQNPRLYQSIEERIKRSNTLMGHSVSDATRNKLREAAIKQAENSIWVNNGVTNKRIASYNFEKYESLGYVLGKI